MSRPEVLKRDLHTVEEIYSLRGADDVKAFLKKNPFLPALLTEARDYIEHYFPDQPLFLEVMHDPEAAAGEELVVFISTELSPDDAESRIQEFDARWWLAAVSRAKGKLCITLEFQ
ncbi:MAG: hypothetical protein HY706_04890 [Candidatus Hydrogenedentes bacterium]|nr:hypothetical protein [Candidatus Hydrogenedentota bacterium]